MYVPSTLVTLSSINIVSADITAKLNWVFTLFTSFGSLPTLTICFGVRYLYLYTDQNGAQARHRVSRGRSCFTRCARAISCLHMLLEKFRVVASDPFKYSSTFLGHLIDRVSFYRLCLSLQLLVTWLFFY